MNWLEPWKDSLKNWSQWINIVIGALGTTYMMLTPEMRDDLPDWGVGVMAALAFLNIFVRNLQQSNKTKHA